MEQSFACPLWSAAVQGTGASEQLIPCLPVRSPSLYHVEREVAKSTGSEDFRRKNFVGQNGSQGTVNAKLPPEGLFLTHTR
jgi:hypothetical protein